MPVGIRFSGTTGTGPPPNTMLPGGGPSSMPGPVRDRIQRDAQADAAWSAMSATGGVQNILAANAAANQDAVRNTIGGGGGSGSGAAFRPLPTPNTIFAGAAGGNANPFNMPLTFAPGTAGFFTRQTATNTTHAPPPPPGVVLPGAGGGGGIPPLPPNMLSPGPPNWGPGMPGQRPPNAPPGQGATPAAPGGGGGGIGIPGGGGGGPLGQGGGGGGRGGLPIPFAGRAGFGATAALMTGAFEAAIIAKTVEEIALAPQTLGHVEMGALASAEPYNKIVLGSTALGRAGGFKGMDLVSGIGAGKLEPPEWMAKLGLGPSEALGLLQNFPITTRSDEQAKNVIESLGSLQFQPALSGLPSGQIEHFAGTAAQAGLMSPTGLGINSIGIILSEPLTKAVQQGFDRASLLRSMEASITQMAQSGGSFGGLRNTSDFLMSFKDLPGGRTGEAAMAASAGISGALDTVTSLSHPARTVAMSSWVNKLQSEGDLKNLFDSTNGAGSWREYTQDAGNRAMADRYLRLRASGQTPFAISALSDLMNSKGGEKVAARMFTDNPVAQQFGNPDVNDMAARNISGMSQRQFDALQRSTATSTLETYADRHNMSSSILQAIAVTESGLDKNAVSPKGAMGIMQLMPGTAEEMGLHGSDVWDARKNAEAGAGYYEKMLKTFHGDHRKALEAYNWGPAHETEINTGKVPPAVANYADTVLRRASQIDEANKPLDTATPGENIPTDTLRGQSGARTAGIYGSSFSSAELNYILPKVNSGLNAVIEAAKEFARSVDAANKSMETHSSTPGGAALMGLH